MATCQEITLSNKDLDTIIAGHKDSPGALLSILEAAQNLSPHKYLPIKILEYISQRLNIPLSRIYSVVTFYAFFNLKPQGEHSITICRGTACHTRRSKNLLEYTKKMLQVQEDESKQGEKVFLTTADNKFTIKTVACFGQCALAPVVEVDGQIYSHMTEEKLKDIIRRTAKTRRPK